MCKVGNRMGWLEMTTVPVQYSIIMKYVWLCVYVLGMNNDTEKQYDRSFKLIKKLSRTHLRNAPDVIRNFSE